MKTIILAILLAVASAGPIPKAFDGRNLAQPYYYSYPGAYAPASYPLALPGDFVMEQQPSPFVVPAVNPAGDRFANPQKIQLLLSVPSAVPPGTSLSVTVNVNSEPNGATVVSVSNPVVSPAAAGAKPPTPDSIVVDANNMAAGQPVAGMLPDEFDLREPILFVPPFENSKDSPVLIEMQGEAQKQQLAALLKTKTA